jgi:hypothetical protein
MERPMVVMAEHVVHKSIILEHGTQISELWKENPGVDVYECTVRNHAINAIAWDEWYIGLLCDAKLKVAAVIDLVT